jgi:hypothetical protein
MENVVKVPWCTDGWVADELTKLGYAHGLWLQGGAAMVQKSMPTTNDSHRIFES